MLTPDEQLQASEWAASEIRRLECRVRELEADGERLDWLELTGLKSERTHHGMGVMSWLDKDGVKFWTAFRVSSEFTNLRDAVDAARRERG